jgi:UDP-N-acetylmuramoylalanine-D-glutamate ligase
MLPGRFYGSRFDTIDNLAYVNDSITFNASLEKVAVSSVCGVVWLIVCQWVWVWCGLWHGYDVI